LKKTIFLLIMLMAFIFPSTNALAGDAPTPIYVDATNGIDTNTGSSSLDAVQTLDKAFSIVTGAGSSYQIIMAAGSYASPGEVNLPANSSVEVVNQGDINDVIIYKDPSSPTDYLFYSSEDGFLSLVFNNLTITGDDPETEDIVEDAGYGIYLDSCDHALGNSIEINSCTLENLEYGINEEYCENITVTVTDSSITAYYPVSMDYGLAINVSNSELTMDESVYYHSAIELNRGSIVASITNNTISSLNGTGIGIYEDIYSGTISGNSFLNLDTALQLNDIHDLSVRDNYVEVTNNGFYLETYFATADIDVLGNTVINKGTKSDYKKGIEIYLDYHTTNGDFCVAGNEIVNFVFGFYYDGYDTDRTISMSFFGDDAGGNTFRGNIINIALDDLRTAGKITATGTDWGTTDSEEVLDRIYVDYVIPTTAPEASEAGSATDVFTFDDTFTTTALDTVYVDDDYEEADAGSHTYGLDAFATIQEALPYLASGGTVEVEDGNYEAPIWLDRPVNLMGIGDDVVIDNDEDDTTSITVTAADTNISGLILNGGYRGVTFSQYNFAPYYSSRPETFSVSGCEFNEQTANALYMDNNDHFMNSGEIIIDGNSFNRSPEIIGGGVAIYIDSTADELNLNNNLIDGYTAGTYLYSTKDITASGNEFTLERGFSDSSLYVSADENVLIEGNTITVPDSYTTDWWNSGIYLNLTYTGLGTGPYTKEIISNSVSGYNWGVYIYGDETDHEAFDIVIGGSEDNANNLDGNEYGFRSQLSNFGSEATDATYNVWGKSEDEIAAYIQDNNDNAAFGLVDYLPYAVPDLDSLTIDSGSLTPAFDSQIYDYSVSVPNETAAITLTPTASFGAIFINDLLLDETPSATIDLEEGLNEITIEVFAPFENSEDSTTYTLDVTREESSSGGGGDGSSSNSHIVVSSEEIDNIIMTNTEVSATTSDRSATANISAAVVEALLDKADAENGTSKGDIIDIEIDAPSNIDQLEVIIPQTKLAEIAEDTDSSFRIVSSLVSVTFDAKALDTISGADSGGNIVVSANIVDPATLSEKDRAKVAGRPVYDLSITNGDTQVSDFGGGKATISIPYTLAEGENPQSVVIYYLANDGTLKTIRGRYIPEEKAVVFTTSHFSNFIIGYNSFSFNDVASNAWYKDAVDFIVARSITTGTGNNNYSPNADLTRGQFIVMLLKAYQIEAANDADILAANFSDAGDTYYSDYLAAAKSLGIAKGLGNNLFAPNKEISRQEMFVLLYNTLDILDELPAASGSNQLADYDDADDVASWANEALSTLIKAGIVSGNNNRIDPLTITTRAQMAQVLYNLLSD